MEKFTIACINENKFVFNDELYLKDVNKLKNDIIQNIELIEADAETMMEIVVDKIGLSKEKDLIGDTMVCFENSNYINQLCFQQMDKEKIEKNKDHVNNLATYLINNEQIVIGNAVFISSSVTDSGLCCNRSTSLDELVKTLYKKFVHKGIILSTNGNIDEYIYQKDPLQDYNADEYQSIEIPISKFNLIAYFKKSTDEEINKKATRLIGHQKVHGDILIVSKAGEDEFINLTAKIFNDLLALSYGPVSRRQLSNDEKKDRSKENNLPIVMNRYCILKKRIENNKKTCNLCRGVLNDDHLICSGCYRVLYHNTDCQKKDWQFHKDDCLHNKKPINFL